MGPFLVPMLASTSLLMPSRIVLLAGVILALPVFARYVYLKRKAVVLEDGLRIVAGCVGILAGLKIMFYACAAEDLKEPDSDRLPVLLGGLALSWIATRTVYRVFKPS